MTYRVRPVAGYDFEAVYEMAKLAGGGLTNLPPDKAALIRKITRSEQAFAREDDVPAGDIYMFVLENVETNLIRGSCQIFDQVGTEWPFYSYRISTLTQTSKALEKTFKAEMLSLVTDLEGACEVGGLFLHPQERASSLGALLARARYMFIKLHRRRFGDRIIAELRGVIDEAGSSPFWDAIGGRFFGGMSFQEADEFNGIHGNQFIADLMPKTPIYTAMLSDTGRNVIGTPHPSGRPAMKMLESEGFAYDCYVDIFDGGPTLSARTDMVRTIREAQQFRLTGASAGITRQPGIVAAGRLNDFRACYAEMSQLAGDEARLDEEAIRLLEIQKGEAFLAAAR